MNNQTNQHPSEEQLMEAALGNEKSSIEDHLAWCIECRTTVDEIRAVEHTVATLDDEEVPSTIEKRIRRISHGGHSIKVAGSGGIGALLSNPMVVAVITALVIVVICVLVASVIFKG